MQIIECAQYSAEWWAARRGVPTASEFSRIITPAKWQYAKGAATYMQELIADLYDPTYGMHEEYVSRVMAIGTQREPEARRYYEFSREVSVEEVGFCKTDDDRFGCSPDGLVGEHGGLELKSPKHATQVKWLLAGGVPAEHLAQCVGFLFVTGRKWIDFLSYCPPLPELLVRVELDDRCNTMMVALDQFWDLYQTARESIAAQVQPPPTRETDFGGGMVLTESIYGESPF
jgi:hypothetical protein